MTNESAPNEGFDQNDPIAAAWAEQSDTAVAPMLPTDTSELATSTASAHRKDQRRLFWLNLREVVPTFFVAGVFAMSAPGADIPLAVAASAALVLGVGLFLLTNSLHHYRADRGWGSSVREQLERRHGQVEHRAGLYRRVWWWYFMPFLSALTLFWWGSAGSPEDNESSLFFWGFILVFTAIMYPVNRVIGRKYEADAEDLAELLADFDRTV